MQEDQQNLPNLGWTLATDGDTGNLIDSLQGWLIYLRLNQEVQFSKLEQVTDLQSQKTEICSLD